MSNKINYSFLKYIKKSLTALTQSGLISLWARIVNPCYRWPYLQITTMFHFHIIQFSPEHNLHLPAARHAFLCTIFHLSKYIRRVSLFQFLQEKSPLGAAFLSR